MPRGVSKSVLETLQCVPLLARCSQKELRQIANLGVHMSAPDGMVLTTEGEAGHEMFVILKGKARCVVNGAFVTDFGAGDFLGVMALLDRGPRRATVTAEGPVDLLVLDDREFDRLLDVSPAISKKLLFTLAERYRENGRARGQAAG